MKPGSVLDLPTAPAATASYLATVVSVQDPDSLGRVQVRLLSFDGVADQDAPAWARVAVPFAGPDRGAFLLPDVGDEVVVVFVNGDARQPLVIGSLWNGTQKPKETLGGDRVDRWTFVGKAGTRIAIVEAPDPTIELSTPGGVTATFTDAGGGKIEFVAAGTTITIDSSGVSVQSASKIAMQGTQMTVDAGTVTVNAGMSTFSGLVKSDVLQTNTVISTTYTPGAGNVW
jgi:phage baseplate assembly protein gpV